MKTLFRYVLLLLVLGCSVTANAQLKFSASDIQLTGLTTWKFKTVVCSSTNNAQVTSITLSMVNNSLVSNNSGINPSQTYTSLGKDPYTVLYLFSRTITTDQVAQFISGIEFRKTNDVSGKPPHVRISVDANPTKLPAGTRITAWKDHPDGSTHYYLWVPYFEPYTTAYNEAKSHYFQGMRGYLPTITSKEEHEQLINISDEGGWSAGARSEGHVMDTKYASKDIRPSVYGTDLFKWHCGPESDFSYYKGIRYDSYGAGPLGKAYNPWVNGEPNNKPFDAIYGKIEWCMQINFKDKRGRGWNDVPDNGATMIKGYFIEFGGNGQAYTVNGASYKANSKYQTPTEFTNNDQWYDFSPGNTASVEANVSRSLRSHVMVIK